MTSVSNVVTGEMRAFHGNPAIKQRYLTRVRQHRAADEIKKGFYWEGGRGCAVGCTIHGASHASYETELGIPQVIAHLEDRIFEGLPVDKAKDWPEAFLSAIRPGADLSMVWSQFAIWLLEDPTDGVIRLVNEDVLGAEVSKQVRDAIHQVAQLFREGCTDIEKWRAAADYTAAWAADSARAAYGVGRTATLAAWAASAAARAAMCAVDAADAAWAAAHAASAAYAVGRTATLAAWAKAYAAADVAAKAAPEGAYVKQSEKLLELLRAA